jgi:hypothetical protein
MNDYLYCTYFRGTWSVVNARVTRSNTHTKKKKKQKNSIKKTTNFNNTRRTMPNCVVRLSHFFLT